MTSRSEGGRWANQFMSIALAGLSVQLRLMLGFVQFAYAVVGCEMIVSTVKEEKLMMGSTPNSANQILIQLRRTVITYIHFASDHSGVGSPDNDVVVSLSVKLNG